MERNGCGAGCLVVLVALTMPLVLLAGTLAAVVAIDAAALEYRAARGEGTAGFFTAQELRCRSRSPCHWYGIYESADGSRIVPDVWIFGYGSGELTEGDRVPALDAGHQVKMFRPGHYDWPGVALWAGFSLALLLLPAYLLRRALRKRPPDQRPDRRAMRWRLPG